MSLPRDVVSVLAGLREREPELYGFIVEELSGPISKRAYARLRQALRRINAGDVRGALMGTRTRAIQRALNARDQKRILYVSSLPPHLLVRQSDAVRAAGYRTYILTQNPFLLEHGTGSFDGVFGWDSPHDLLKVFTSTRPTVIHVRGSIFASTFVGVLAREVSEAAVVYEFYDVASFMFNPADAATWFGTDRVQLEYCSERYVAKRSHGIIHGYNEAGERLLRNVYDSHVPMIEFHPYVGPLRMLPSSRRPDGEIRLVFAGGVQPSRLPKPLFGDSQLIDLATELARHGLTFHIFTSPYLSPQRLARDYADYIALARVTRGFAFRIGVSYDRLPRALNSYDYGVMLHFRDGLHVRKQQYHHRLPAKFFAYLEAGLPIIVSEDARYPASLVREMGIGVVVAKRDMPRLRDILKDQDQAKLRRNVAEAQHHFAIDRHRARLARFYDTIADSV